jgi:hypothetical protein
MRRLADAERLRRFLRALGAAADRPGRVYLTGGATAVLVGWRESTIDADVLFEPETDALFRALPRLKEELELNVEIAAPSHFIPELGGWRERSPLVAHEGPLEIRHYDFYAQALAKLERAHEQDLADVREMLARGLVEPARLEELFESIVPQLYRYPALDEASFRRHVESFVS